MQENNNSNAGRSQLTETFKIAIDYIDKGYSVMPIRLSQEGRMGAKSPLFSFVKNPEWCKDKGKIFNAMERCTVDVGVALVTGVQSNNLMCIDIDEKYKAGISKIYLSTIESIYPDLYKKLRLETTQNHGIHIPFHTKEKALKSEDLASRLASESELEEKPQQKKYCFIETRGENATFIIPPTDGYSFIEGHKKDIPTLSENERDILINVAKSFHEIETKVVNVKVSPKGMRNYNVNPWEDYDNDTHFLSVLKGKGWKPTSKSENDNRNHQYFTRPGGTKGDVHASWVKDKNIFYCFTTSSEFDPDKGYSPSSVLSILNFNDDKKETFKWLIENGYGKYDERYEDRVIERAIINNRLLPKNLSKKGQEKFEKEKEKHENKYPFGIFWEQTERNGEVTYKINKELILRIAKRFNYYLLDGSLIYVDEHNRFIEYTDNQAFFNDLKSYVKESELINIQILDRFESYLQQSGKFLITRLDEFDKEKILKDSRFICWKVFNNVILKITKNEIKQIQFSELDKYFFKRDVIDYDFSRISSDDPSVSNCLFIDFMKKALINTNNFKQNAGYYLHNYNHPADAYFQINTETTINPKLGGGSGKDLMAALIGMCTTSITIAGSQVKLDNTFLQSWNGERMVNISDIPKRFDLEKIKAITSNAVTVKKLYKDEVVIQAVDLPKILVSTNYSFYIADGGVKRRLIFNEYSDFFTKAGGVDVHYGGKQFPDDWSDLDWLGYYNFMMESVQVYLSNKKLSNNEISETGWIKQFSINHGEPTFEFISGNMSLFLKSEFVSKTQFENVYANYISENGILPKYRKSAQGMNEALEEYCNHYGIEFDKRLSKHLNGVKQTVRWFNDPNSNANKGSDDAGFERDDDYNFDRIEGDDGLPF